MDLLFFLVILVSLFFMHYVVDLSVNAVKRVMTSIKDKKQVIK